MNELEHSMCMFSIIFLQFEAGPQLATTWLKFSVLNIDKMNSMEGAAIIFRDDVNLIKRLKSL